MISSWWDNLHKTKWGLHRSKKPNKDDSNHDVAHIRPHHTLNGFFSNFPQSFQSFITLGHCWHGWGRSWYWIGPDWNLSLQRFISDYPHFPDGIVSKTGIPNQNVKKTWNINCGFLATPGENMWFEMLLCKSPWIKLRSSFWTLRSCRLRAVSYFSLQSYYTRILNTRAAKPGAARNEGVVWSQSLIVIITSWFAIALDEIRTRRILREKADCQQSTALV